MNRLLLLGGAAVVVGAVIAWQWWENQPSAAAPPTVDGGLPPKSFPVPQFAKSRFRNTSSDATHVGVQACAKCHQPQYKSYLLTEHSRAYSDLDPKAEPADGSFEHKPSGRSYRVYRSGGKFRHEEVHRGKDGKEFAKVDLPIRYLIGSGHFTRSYVVEVDGFLHESPITWYTSRNQWDVSPGYDNPFHEGFARMVDVGCLICHTGRVEPLDNSMNRVKFHELAIGCESCHGPGSLHKEHHDLKKPVEGGQDWTIVHPGTLSRDRREAICALCHLRGDATIQVRGRSIDDFRPGMPLEDYRIDYQYRTNNESMKVVGHVEQMRLSKCYVKSKELTCTTCHDPHARSKPDDPVAYYKQTCLDCHAPKECDLELGERLKKEPKDNCVACHMPRGDTDILHVAFTHHRIGVHKKRKPEAGAGVPELAPMSDDSHLSQIDRRRNLGLAYLEVSSKQERAAAATAYQRRARQLLQSVYDQGLKDGDTLEGLARLHWSTDRVKAVEFATEALRKNDLPGKFRANALVMLADQSVRTGHAAAALPHLQELVRLRRHPADWLLLGKCHLDRDEPQKALAAMQTAVSIDPFQPSLHKALADTYRRLGDHRRQKEHEDKARQLAER